MAATNPAPLGPGNPVTTVSTSDLESTSVSPAASGAGALYPAGIPEPSGTTAGEDSRAQQGANTDPTGGTGVEGELIVWQGHYSARNFLGRWLAMGLLVAAWVVLISRTTAQPDEPMSRPAMAVGVVVLVLALILIYRMILARYSHYYRLTTRRLFVSTGFIHRRRDMMELLRVKDVFTRQLTVFDRLLGLGTVVVAPSDKDIPTLLIAGVAEPKRVMDLIWHHARSERDQRSVKVDSV